MTEPEARRIALVRAAIAVVIVSGFVLGLTVDAIGPSGRLNILSPPRLGLLVWNAAVYAVLLVAAMRARATGSAAPGPLRRALLDVVARWTGAGGALQGARLAATLHAAAAALAVGALCSLYLRGLVFEYRAGWDSTFLTAPWVHRLVSLVLGPASLWSGIALPTADELVRLRFSAGEGENAARWIHLYAITLVAFVVLPRLALAMAAAWRARRLSQSLQAQRGTPLAVDVLPYSYHPPAGAVPPLRKALERELGRDVQPALAETVPLGGEDDLAHHLPARVTPAATVAALFSLTATPERETHGAFVRALAEAVPERERLMVLVDESGFRQRFDDATRLAQRREAWRRMLNEEGRDALFVDLTEKAP